MMECSSKYACKYLCNATINVHASSSSAVQMEAVTIIIRTQWYVAVTGSFLWISMYRDAPPQPKRCSTASCSCRRRSAAASPSACGTGSESEYCSKIFVDSTK